MSAFCDILIEGKQGFKPQFTRSGNTAWAHHTYYWQSTPADKVDYPFLNTVENEDYKLVILGQFYEQVDNQVLLKDAIAYCSGLVDRYTDPAGHYILFLIDKQHGDVHVLTNRFGTYHAYVYNDGITAAIATFYLGLAKQAKNKDLDWEGLTGFFTMGFFPNDNTYLQCIKVLEPATHYHFDAYLKKVKQRRYWNWVESNEQKSTDEYLHDLHTSLSTSLNTAVAGKRVALPISGGLDSRTIAGVLTNDEEKSYASIWGYSYGFAKGPKETKVAHDIARTRNIPFHYYAVPRYLFDNITRIAESTDLFSYIDGTRQASTVDMLREKSDVVVGGHWGDVWLDGMGVEREEDFLPFFRNKIVKRGANWFIDNLCNEHVLDSNELLNDYFQTTISKYDYIKNPDLRIKAYKTDNWSFRWTLSGTRMYQAGAMPVLPFYDKNVVDVLTNIPVALLKERGLQIEYLKKYHRDLAKVAWQEYGTNLFLYKTINNRNLFYRAYHKVKRNITSGKFITRNWELFYLNEEGRQQLEKALLGNDKLTEIVGRDKVKGFINEFYNNPTRDNGYTMSMLHTFARFVEYVY